MDLCDVNYTQKKKVTWFSQQFQFYKKKFEKFWQNMGNRCRVPLNFVIVFILSQWSQHYSALLLALFCDKFISSSTFCTNSLIVLIPCVKGWDIHFACIAVKLQQSIDWIDWNTDWNLHERNKILWTRQPYSFHSLYFIHIPYFIHFDFESVLSSNTHSWLSNIYYR